MNNRILIIAEHDGSRLNPSTAKCVTCGAAIPDGEITVAVCAAEAGAIASQAAALLGVARVLTLEHPVNAHPLAAVLAPQIAALAGSFTLGGHLKFPHPWPGQNPPLDSGETSG